MQLKSFPSVTTTWQPVTWFFWNPDNWEFDWEPIVVLLISLASFIYFDTSKEKSSAPSNKADQKLFEEFLSLLPSKEIEILSQHDFWVPFHVSEVEALRVYKDDWQDPEHEFKSDHIANAKATFDRSVFEFWRILVTNSSSNGDGVMCVRTDHDGNDKETYLLRREEAKEINESADNVVLRHREFVRLCRNELGV